QQHFSFAESPKEPVRHAAPEVLGADIRRSAGIDTGQRLRRDRRRRARFVVHRARGMTKQNDPNVVDDSLRVDAQGRVVRLDPLMMRESEAPRARQVELLNLERQNRYAVTFRLGDLSPYPRRSDGAARKNENDGPGVAK